VTAARVTADEVVALLAARHPAKDSVFVPECKMGQGGSRRLDAWVLSKTWSPWTITGYEVKVSRQDFINDDKWADYLPVCHLLYFACPSGLIQPNELPAEVGLLWVAGSRLVTKKKAARREPDPVKVARLMSYVLMSRSRIVADMWASADEEPLSFWRRWLDAKKDAQGIGHKVSERLAECLHQERELRRKAEAETARFEDVRERLREMGFDPSKTVYSHQFRDKLEPLRAGRNQVERSLRDARQLVQSLEHTARTLDEKAASADEQAPDLDEAGA
jgi:hypothetical protein